MSTTLLSLDEMLLKAIGDFLQHPVTTSLTTSTSVVSTHLTKYRAVADHFNKFWCYIEDLANEGDHYILDDDGTNTLTSFDTFVAEAPTTGKATFRLSMFPWADRIDAINRACKQIYPDLFQYLENTDLVTGNILPPFNWSTTALLDIYAEPSGTLLKTTDGDYIRRGSSSAKVTASGANDVISIDSTDYPRLLDLMGHTITYRCYAHPVTTADDAFLTITYVDEDGDTTTTNSTTTCETGQFTLLEIEDLAIPDNIKQIQFRMRVLTTLLVIYFDQPRVTGITQYDYLLPTDFQDGTVSQVFVQSSGYSDDLCDDLHPIHWEERFDWSIKDDGTYKYLHLPCDISERQIKLIGYGPLEELTLDTSTIPSEGKELELLIAYAAHLLYETQAGKLIRDIDAKDSAIVAVEAEIATEDGLITGVATSIATATTSIATADTNIATEDTAITAIATDIATIVTQVDTELVAIDNVGSEDVGRYDAKIARLDGKKKRIEDKRDALQDKRKRLLEQRAGLDEDIKRLVDTRDALQDKRHRLIIEKTALDFDIKRIDDKKARFEHESYEWLAKYRMRSHLRMVTPRMSMKLNG